MFPECSFFITDFCALSSLFNSGGLNNRIYFKVFFSVHSLSFSLWVGLVNFELHCRVFSWTICRGNCNVSILVSLLLSWSKLLLCSLHHFFRSLFLCCLLRKTSMISLTQLHSHPIWWSHKMVYLIFEVLNMVAVLPVSVWLCDKCLISHLTIHSMKATIVSVSLETPSLLPSTVFDS